MVFALFFALRFEGFRGLHRVWGMGSWGLSMLGS